MEKRASQLFFPRRFTYVVGGANGILYVDIDMFMFTHRKVSEWSLLIEFITPV